MEFKKGFQTLLKPIDIAPLVYFRIMFGLIMFIEVIRFFAHGWIAKYYITPTFFFKYYGFSWVQPWPGNWMYFHFIVLGVLALFIMVGLYYRMSTILFFLGFSYVFLLDQTNHLNHFYFIILLSFLMMFIPAHRAFSLDAWRRPKIKSQTIPAWSLWIIMLQVAIVYFYGGIAKLNADWLSGHNLGEMLSPTLLNSALFQPTWMLPLVSWLVALFLLAVVPLLLWKKTTLFAFILAVGFHLHNVIAFSIGIFPWLMIAATALFFPSHWFRFGKKIRLPKQKHHKLPRSHRILFVILAIFLLIQLTVPFRHLLYPGDVSWTEEGHRFAWHMKMRTKSSYATYYMYNPATNNTIEIHPRDFLSSRQTSKMSTRPDMILQFAHHVAQKLGNNISVYADIRTSLNGHEERLLLDPTVDLVTQPRILGHVTWIMPFDESPVNYTNPMKPAVWGRIIE